MQGLVVLLALVATSLAGNVIPRAPRLDGRIVGGIPVDIKQYPYQLSLEHRNRHICGASIISATKALTAAHCVKGNSASSLTVRAGSSFRGSGGEVVKVQSVSSHPRYSENTLDYDIAVLHLAGSITKGTALSLSEPNKEVASGSPATVSGWGNTKENGSLANQLQAVEIQIVSHAECERRYKNVVPITPRMICAGTPQGGKNSCQGDSGGPLMVGGRQVGIVSFAVGCARPEYPTVFAKVSNLRNWIKQVSGV